MIGDPVAHGLSPLVQNAAFEATGFDGVYLPFRVFRQFLGRALDEFQWLGVRGYSVTIPHKEAVLEEVPRHDDMVDEIGASNTLYRDERLLWHAANTDYESALQRPRIHPRVGRRRGAGRQKGSHSGSRGGGPAIGLGLSAPVAASPSPAARMPAHLVAQRLGCQQIQWENRGAIFADILVNCTPVGMFPNVDETLSRGTGSATT